MNALVAWPLVIQGIVPLGMILAIAMGPNRSLASWVVHVLAAAAFLAAIGLAGLWLALPWYTPWVMMVPLAGSEASTPGGRHPCAAGSGWWPPPDSQSSA